MHTHTPAAPHLRVHHLQLALVLLQQQQLGVERLDVALPPPRPPALALLALERVCQRQHVLGAARQVARAVNVLAARDGRLGAADELADPVERQRYDANGAKHHEEHPAQGGHDGHGVHNDAHTHLPLVLDAVDEHVALQQGGARCVWGGWGGGRRRRSVRGQAAAPPQPHPAMPRPLSLPAAHVVAQRRQAFVDGGLAGGVGLVEVGEEADALAERVAVVAQVRGGQQARPRPLHVVHGIASKGCAAGGEEGAAARFGPQRRGLLQQR